MSRELSDDELKQRSQELAARHPASARYRHYRGKVYVIVATSLYKDGLESMVHYRGENGVVFTQLERKFTETVIKDSKPVPRFVRVMDRLTDVER